MPARALAGSEIGLWAFGTVVLGGLVLGMTAIACAQLDTWTRVLHAPAVLFQLASFFAFVLFMAQTSPLLDFEYYNVGYETFAEPTFWWLAAVLVPATLASAALATRAWHLQLFATPVDHARADRGLSGDADALAALSPKASPAVRMPRAAPAVAPPAVSAAAAAAPGAAPRRPSRQTLSATPEGVSAAVGPLRGAMADLGIGSRPAPVTNVAPERIATLHADAGLPIALMRSRSASWFAYDQLYRGVVPAADEAGSARGRAVGRSNTLV